MNTRQIDYLTGEGRRLCQFTTPDILAEVMAFWAITSSDDSVLDPCCGNSNLLEKAMDRLLSLGASPRKAAKQTYGIEISPRTAKIANATLLNKYGPGIPNVVTADFLRIKPGEIPLFKAIICNPPYKRHQRLGKRYKAEIAKVVGQERAVTIPGTSNQYVHFLLHALSFIAPKGRMVFLLPSQYLTNDFGKVLRDFLGRNLMIHHVILFDERLPVFPNSMSTASLVLIENSIPDPAWTTSFAKLDSVRAVSGLLSDQGVDGNAAATVRTVPQQTLLSAGKWARFFYKTTVPPNEKSLADIADVTRGIATGANEFFFLSDGQVKDKGLPPKYLTPILVRAHDAPYPDFGKWDWTTLRRQGKRVWMLDCQTEKQNLEDSNLSQYIEWGEKERYNEGYLTSHRNPWYRTENRKPAMILFTYMSNGRPRFIYNKGRTLTSNAFHSIYPKGKFASDPTYLKALLAFLNSSYTTSRLASVGRTYSGGLLKLEPSDTKAVPVPDFESLNKSKLRLLARAFRDLCGECRHSGTWDTAEIDRLVREMLKPIPG